MKYLSTNHNSPQATLKQAVLNGLAGDGGLYMAEKIPPLPRFFLKKLPSLTFKEIALEVEKVFFAPEIPEKDLQKIIKSSFTFPAPLKILDENLAVLELFHGPTLSFKDFGARFMANVMSFFLQKEKKPLTILAATSGDTGSAVGRAFFQKPNVRAILLYPKGKVSHIQEQQITTIGGNISALEVKGTFDDCQRLAKQAFSDPDLKQKMFLSSANSINIARLLPQSIYYFAAWKQLAEKNFPLNNVVFSVPSGNLGNVTAGLIAKKLGLPVSKFIVSLNRNNIFSNYLKTGIFHPKPSKKTISNSMDVGNPSNFARISALYKGNLNAIRKDTESYSFSDTQTKKAIREVYQKHHCLLDPHSAVAYLGFKKHLKNNKKAVGVILSTAHPAKFADIVEPAIGEKVRIPVRLKKSFDAAKKSTPIAADYQELKNYLIIADSKTIGFLSRFF